MVNFDLIKKLIQICKEEEISGLSIEENGVKYEVKREFGGVREVHHAVPQEKHHEEKKVEPEAKKEINEDDGLIAITSFPPAAK